MMRLLPAERHAKCGGLSNVRSAGMQRPQIAGATSTCRHPRLRQRKHIAVAAISGGGPDVADVIDQSLVHAAGSSPAKRDADLAADIVEAAQPHATSGERQRLLAVAKQRIAVLRAAKAAQQSAHQPDTSADQQEAAVQPAATAQSVGARPSAVEATLAVEKPRIEEATTAAAAAAAAEAAQPGPQSTASSPGAVAARSARQRDVVSASAAWAPAAGAAPAFPPKDPKTKRRVQRSTETVDAQRYEQVVASRNRLASQLSRANRYVAHLEAELAGRSADVGAAAASLAQAGRQLQQLLRQAGLAAGDGAAGSSGGSSQAYALTQTLARFQQQLQRHQRKLEESAVQSVPLAWVGVASEVRLMGSFDGWSRGVALSSAGDAGDAVFHRFEGTLHACRGEYTVKFMVDGQWRLAPHWPTRDDATGTTNNVLQID